MVYFNMYGRLGNLLFQYAAALSLGKGKAVGVTPDPEVVAVARKAGSLFAGLEIVPRAPEGALLLRQDKLFGPIEFPDVTGRDVLLDGFFQSERYVDEKLVRAAYAIPSELERQLRERFAVPLAAPNVTSIHVRRGDYLAVPQCHPFVGEDYFRDCLARLPDCRDFIVCSDDLPWCRSFFPQAFPDRHFTFSETGGPIEDVYLCSLCRNNIMSNSSFSWWGAWLNANPGKRVLAPSRWFGFALAHDWGIDWSPIYFKGAEIVRNRFSPLFWLKAHWADFVFRRRARAERRRRDR